MATAYLATVVGRGQDTRHGKRRLNSSDHARTAAPLSTQSVPVVQGMAVRSVRRRGLLPQPLLLLEHLRELLVGGLEHVRQRHRDAGLFHGAVARRDPLLKAEGEELRERLDVLHAAAHGLHQVLELGLVVPVDAEGEQRRAPEHHGDGVVPGHAETGQELELRCQGALHAGDEEDRVLQRQRAVVPEAQAAEVDERGAELVADAAGEHARALDDDATVRGLGHAEVLGEEGEDGAEVGADAGGEHGRAHAEDAAEVLEVEPAGLKERHHRVDGLRRRVAERRVQLQRAPVVHAHQLQAQDLVLHLRRQLRQVQRQRRRRRGHRRRRRRRRTARRHGCCHGRGGGVGLGGRDELLRLGDGEGGGGVEAAERHRCDVIRSPV
jgi:hypothetical protein